MSAKTDLEDFVEEERLALHDFASYWRGQHACSPEKFPYELERGEWLEQFNFWVEGEQRKISELENTP